jgi:hypothetical protein
MENRDAPEQMVLLNMLIPRELKADAKAKASYYGTSLGAYVRRLIVEDVRGKPKKVQSQEIDVTPREFSLTPLRQVPQATVLV